MHLYEFPTVGYFPTATRAVAAAGRCKIGDSVAGSLNHSAIYRPRDSRQLASDQSAKPSYEDEERVESLKKSSRVQCVQ